MSTFVHNMVEVEVEYTLQYMEVLRRLGRDIPKLEPVSVSHHRQRDDEWHL